MAASDLSADPTVPQAAVGDGGNNNEFGRRAKEQDKNPPAQGYGISNNLKGAAATQHSSVNLTAAPSSSKSAAANEHAAAEVSRVI